MKTEDTYYKFEDGKLMERFWNVDKFRKMCIKHDFCDVVTNKIYNLILGFVGHADPTDDSIVVCTYMIAANTSKFIDAEEDERKRYFDYIADCILNETITYMLSSGC